MTHIPQSTVVPIREWSSSDRKTYREAVAQAFVIDMEGYKRDTQYDKVALILRSLRDQLLASGADEQEVHLIVECCGIFEDTVE